MCVIFNSTSVIIVTDTAKTAKNPVFMPKIVKIIDIRSPEFVASKMVENVIFSGEANLGTLRIAFIKNKTNREIETIFAWFWSRGNLISMAFPRIIPCRIPMPNAASTALIENTGSEKTSTRNGASAIFADFLRFPILVSCYVTFAITVKKIHRRLMSL